MIAAIQQAVDEINEQFAQVEQIKRFTLLGEEWLPDSDVLTPTSKLKRRGVHARYAREIEAMYACLDYGSQEHAEVRGVRVPTPVSDAWWSALSGRQRALVVRPWMSRSR